ncbi:hypothetical protein Tco_0342938 [Tanacetum coccineum]
MMLDCSKDCIRATRKDLDRVTWHHHHLRYWSFEVQRHLPPHLHCRETPYVTPTVPVVPVDHDDPADLYVVVRDAAIVPATNNDDPAAREETSPSKPQGFPPRDS